MNKIHLSEAQRKLCIEFACQTNRPTPKEYDDWCRRMKAVSPTGKPPRYKQIPHATKGFESKDVKLEPEFNALTDLPEGWAVTSCFDSGGNHAVESAGQAVMRAIYNSWAGHRTPAPKTLAILG